MRDVPRSCPTVAVVIPCLNEGDAIGGLVAEVLAVAGKTDLAVDIDRILVVDNGSTDHTALSAGSAGASVVSEPRRGYGRACLSGVLAAEGAEIIVLMDGDCSDVPAELPLLLGPLLSGDADLVVGSRILGTYEPGSLLPQQIFGNRVATAFLRLGFGVRMTDIGPFRAIRRETLLALGMRELTYGWSIEMVARAAKAGLRVQEVPVSYRKRAAGVSKVSGNLGASIKAGYRIMLAVIRARRDSLPLPPELERHQAR